MKLIVPSPKAVLFTLCCAVCLLALASAEDIPVLQSNRPNVFGKDRLQWFYERIKQADVKYCEDRTRLLPDCKECIPGLQQGSGSSTCSTYVPSSEAIRSEILKLTKERYKEEKVEGRMARPYGLYPYLEKGDFMVRQELFGRILSKSRAQNVVDIGAYYNPIHLFLDSQSQGSTTSDYCPESVLIIEPILDALSVMIPCGEGKGAGSTHVMFMPITFRQYMKQVINKTRLPRPDSVVCIGCDSHYGMSCMLCCARQVCGDNLFPPPHSYLSMSSPPPRRPQPTHAGDDLRAALRPAAGVPLRVCAQRSHEEDAGQRPR